MLAWLLGAQGAALPRQVLVVYSMGREFAPFSVMAGTFRAELSKRANQPIEFHEVALETARSIQGANEEPLVNYLEAMFANRQLDLIVTLGGPATLFLQAHRELPFANVPLITTLDLRRVQASPGLTNAALVPLQLDLQVLIENILQPFPATTNIVVTMGATPLSRYWTEQCMREFAPFTNRITFTYLGDRSLEQMRQELQSLPEHSAILYGDVTVDAAGVPHERERALTSLRAVANAPMFGVYEHQVGLGIVGGRLISNELWGRRVAEAALRVLGGAPASEVVSPPTGPGTPVYDWRELRRWQIPETRLPAGSEVRFREPSLWESHARTVSLGVGIILLQAWLIGWLLVQRRRRRRAEAQLRESERRFRSLADTAPVMIWMSDTTGECTYFNQRWLDFTGRPQVQGPGGRWTGLVHPEDAPAHAETYREALELQAPFTLECRLRRHDGGYRWVCFQGVPRVTPQGEFLGHVASCVDVTEPKQTEEATRRLAHAARVSTLGQMTAALAHELNQPLGAILRRAEAGELLMQQDPPDCEQVRAILSSIRRDDQRAGAVIDRIRSFMKRRALDLEPLVLRELLEQVALLVHAELRSRRVRLDVDTPSGLPRVRGDLVQLQQVLINLILNAADALNGAPDATRHLHVTARRPALDTVEVAVCDHGPGIEKATLPTIFEPFVSTKPDGMGLGLAISQNIIKAHGGRLWVEDTPGGGATFRFTLSIEE